MIFQESMFYRLISLVFLVYTKPHQSVTRLAVIRREFETLPTSLKVLLSHHEFFNEYVRFDLKKTIPVPKSREVFFSSGTFVSQADNPAKCNAVAYKTVRL